VRPGSRHARPWRGRGLGARRWDAPAAALLAAMVLASCGGGGHDEGPAATPEPTRKAAGPDEQGSRSGAASGGDEGGSRGDGPAAETPAPDGSAAGGACVFAAPEGRLARDEVTIELDGVACAEAIPLAKAAALGQPAGANLTIESRGYACEPSTKAKGENVTYACTGPAGEAGFEVVWSAPAG
jgi:hypothetical protein